MKSVKLIFLMGLMVINASGLPQGNYFGNGFPPPGFAVAPGQQQITPPGQDKPSKYPPPPVAANLNRQPNGQRPDKDGNGNQNSEKPENKDNNGRPNNPGNPGNNGWQLGHQNGKPENSKNKPEKPGRPGNGQQNGPAVGFPSIVPAPAVQNPPISNFNPPPTIPAASQQPAQSSVGQFPGPFGPFGPPAPEQQASPPGPIQQGSLGPPSPGQIGLPSGQQSQSQGPQGQSQGQQSQSQGPQGQSQGQQIQQRPFGSQLSAPLLGAARPVRPGSNHQHPQPSHPSSHKHEPVIIRQYQESHENGYSFGYELSDRTSRDEWCQLYQCKADPRQGCLWCFGSYQYVEGRVLNQMKYYTNEDGNHQDFKQTEI